ncbi:helix-turn-helix transcriptional regulator [Paenibacillus sp. MBLB4367]|uniref:helix-turn-helix transcriptional regulator n=1 Tax=Paenibacillus sp. MBLB4367 TaxID=3384767 RepID=UPI00390831A2
MFKSQRLIQLMMTVNAKRKFTVKELAQEFQVSERTIARDLQDLSELGVPLYAEQGRGGGYRVLKERMLPPIAFTENEAVAMFFACQSLQYYGALPFEPESASGLQKLYHYLSADVKDQIDKMKERVLFCNPSREQPADYLRLLMRAAVRQTVVAIEYDSSSGVAKRHIQPVGIYASHGFWYCPAYCFERKDYRLFRADRVLHAEETEELKPNAEASKASVWEWLAPDGSKEKQVRLVVSLTKEGVRRCRSNYELCDSIRLHDDGSGLLDAMIPVSQLVYFTDTVWEYGKEAKVEQPEEAVRYMKEKIKALYNSYGLESERTKKDGRSRL